MAVTGVFVVPPIAMQIVGVLLVLEFRLFGVDHMAMLPAPPWSIFISLMGILGVVWAAARLIVLDDRLCRIDAIARVFVALLILWGLFAIDLPWVFAAFIVTELIGTIATALTWKRAYAR